MVSKNAPPGPIVEAPLRPKKGTQKCSANLRHGSNFGAPLAPKLGVKSVTFWINEFNCSGQRAQPEVNPKALSEEAKP